MFPGSIADFYASHQELLWLTTLLVDLGCTLVLYRLFGKAGLQIAIALAPVAAKYLFKIVIAMIEMIFIYWARYMYRHGHPAEMAT